MKTLISVYCHQRLLFTRYIVIYLFIPRARLNFVQAVFIRFQGFMEKFIEINILVFQDIQASSLCYWSIRALLRVMLPSCMR